MSLQVFCAIAPAVAWTLCCAILLVVYLSWTYPVCQRPTMAAAGGYALVYFLALAHWVGTSQREMVGDVVDALWSSVEIFGLAVILAFCWRLYSCALYRHEIVDEWKGRRCR